jgi:N-acetylmuramoyl-L-alanine amidase
MATIVLDPGHGGTVKVGGSSPNNARGPGGLLEKTVTLDLGLRAEAVLAARGHRVILTRRVDANLGLSDRAAAARSVAAPVFVSIHLNGFDGVTQGTETICHTDHISVSADLCRAVQARLVAATGHRDRNAVHPGGVKRQALDVLRRSSHHPRTACVLAEISFMDVAAEEARLRTDAYLGRIAAALADGVDDYLSARPEAVAVRRSFGDGFEAAGARAEPLRADEMAGSVTTEVLPDLPADPEAMADRDEREDSGSPAGGAAFAESSGFPRTEFDDFIRGLGLRHFAPGEFLVLGGAHHGSGPCAGLNTFPPRALWPNIANTARMIDEIRHRLGHGVIITNAYRAPAYNTCIDGATASAHMLFNALDMKGTQGTAASWHAVAKAVRASDPRFTGGIGRYNTFVHIDTRGVNANW